MSTLQDIHRTSMDYVLSLEALIHTTPGLKPGYLPERDAHYLLSGVRITLFILPAVSSFSESASLVQAHFLNTISTPFPGPQYADFSILHGRTECSL